MNDKPLTVLVSVYACGPDWGSEVGMGWNWVVALSRYCQLHVITEKGFQESIERSFKSSFAERYMPVFHYIDIGEKARQYFWQQGNWLFYPHYRVWQRKASDYARQLLREESFPIVHQLNMVGFREPGFLWKIPGEHLYIWGPICGMGTVPPAFFQQLNWRQRMKYRFKNFINLHQQKYSARIKNAVQRADALLTVTAEEQRIIRKHYGKETILFPEVGTFPLQKEAPRKINRENLRLVWCGIMEGRKGLDILLHALASLHHDVLSSIELHIIGAGPCFDQWKKLHEQLNLQKYCIWHGRTDHDTALKMIDHADILVFTSWKEATSTVITEALSAGIGVICHDTCGMSYAITDDCGIKIPFESPEQSIRGFAAAIEKVNQERELIEKYSKGALQRTQELSWDNCAKRMSFLYASLIESKMIAN